MFCKKLDCIGVLACRRFAIEKFYKNMLVLEVGYELRFNIILYMAPNHVCSD